MPLFLKYWCLSLEIKFLLMNCVKQTPSPMEHVFTRINTLTDDQIVDSYVRDVESGHGNMRYFACKYSGCTYPVAFCTQREAVQHVHYAHLDLGTQAFVCITWCVFTMDSSNVVQAVLINFIQWRGIRTQTGCRSSREDDE